MFDIKYIRANPSLIQKAAQEKKVTINIDHLLEIDQKRSELQQSVQTLQEKRNALAKSISGKPTHEQIEKGKQIKGHLEKEEHALNALKEEVTMLLNQIPNPAKPDVKVGKDES